MYLPNRGDAGQQRGPAKTQNTGADKRVSKRFAESVPQALGQWKEKAEGRVLAASSSRREVPRGPLTLVPRIRPESAACPATDGLV